jgi:plastocyanin
MKPAFKLLGLIGLALATGCLEPNVNARADTPYKDVMVDDDFFTPDSIKIVPGQAIRWVWQGDDQHNVTWDAGMGTAEQNSLTQAAGEHYRQFDELGTYSYHCTIHPGMIAYVKVVPYVVPELPL